MSSAASRGKLSTRIGGIGHLNCIRVSLALDTSSHAARSIRSLQRALLARILLVHRSRIPWPGVVCSGEWVRLVHDCTRSLLPGRATASHQRSGHPTATPLLRCRHEQNGKSSRLASTNPNFYNFFIVFCFVFKPLLVLVSLSKYFIPDCALYFVFLNFLSRKFSDDRKFDSATEAVEN